MPLLKLIGKVYLVLLGVCLSLGIFSAVSGWIREKVDEWEFCRGMDEYYKAHPR